MDAQGVASVAGVEAHALGELRPAEGALGEQSTSAAARGELGAADHPLPNTTASRTKSAARMPGSGGLGMGGP